MSKGTKNHRGLSSGPRQGTAAQAAAQAAGLSNYGGDYPHVAQAPQSYTGGSCEGSTTHQSGVKTRPIHEIRLGRVVAAIWENRTEQGHLIYNVTIGRIYKQDEQWRETQSFGRDDLPLAIKVLDQCHTWIFAHRAQPANQSMDRS